MDITYKSLQAFIQCTSGVAASVRLLGSKDCMSREMSDLETIRVSIEILTMHSVQYSGLGTSGLAAAILG